MVAEENPVRSYVLNGFIHTRTYQPLHDADFASEVVHGGLGGAWAGAVIGGASAWYRTPVLRAIFAQAVRGAGWYGALGATFIAGSWFSANKIRHHDDSMNAAVGGAAVGLLVGASTLVPTKAFGYPALFAGVAFLTQNAIDTLLTNSLARKYENPTPSMKGKTREGFWAWPKSPAQIDLTEFEQK